MASFPTIHALRGLRRKHFRIWRSHQQCWSGDREDHFFPQDHQGFHEAKETSPLQLLESVSRIRGAACTRGFGVDRLCRHDTCSGGQLASVSHQTRPEKPTPQALPGRKLPPPRLFRGLWRSHLPSEPPGTDAVCEALSVVLSESVSGIWGPAVTAAALRIRAQIMVTS